MSIYDWSQFTKRIPISVPPDVVYNAWTSQEMIERWFLSKAIFKTKDNNVRKKYECIQVDDQYEWWWFGYPETLVEKGKILEANGKDRLKFIFGRAGMVTVNITTMKGTSICELVQSEIPADEASKVKFHLGCNEGWTFYLANLKSILEGGLDLRNKDEEVANVVNS